MNTYSVIMLGPSGSGKTVFLSSMYKNLSTQGKRGFFLKFDSAENRKRLINTYAELATDEKWPVGTLLSEVSEWEFTCCVQTEDLSIYDACKFVYIDYAGGRLTDEMGEEDEEFNSKIRAADTMLVLLDGQRLCNLMRKERDGVIWVIRDLSNILGVVQNIKDKPVHFVISKWDIVEPHYSLQEIRDRLLEIEEFSDLVRIRNKVGVPVRLIPVSSVGKEFATLQSDGRMAKNLGIIPKPFQLEAPLACILPDKIKIQVRELTKKIIEEKGRNIEVKPELGFGEVAGQFFGLLGGGVKNIQQLLPEKYRFDENVLEDLIEGAERPAREKEAQARRRTEELRAKQREYINQVNDEKTALDSAISSFLSIKNQLDIDFPESDLGDV
ncbi:MAG: hypothetical protein QNJ68_06615 [Microcoleaceae cyanobacterium MO_207.B10]|nr:hypothetical protein [Microcoleaceae cyanobacterium MO_207.B10]